jgi:hypothetical protein
MKVNVSIKRGSEGWAVMNNVVGLSHTTAAAKLAIKASELVGYVRISEPSSSAL